MSEDPSTTDLSAVDDAQLTAWAYGRASSAHEADRAHRAALELVRRAEHTVSLEAAQTAGATRGAAHPTIPRLRTDERADSEPMEDEDEADAGMGFRGRVAIGAGVAVLLVGAVIASQALLAPRPSTATSLAIFDRAETAEERALVGLFEREGDRVSIGPRELGDVGFGTIVAYRSLVNSSGVNEPTLDLVCVAAAEFNRRTQNTMISDSTCVARTAFEQEGLSTTLYGIGGQYDVEWGPTGSAELDVLISEAQRLVMEPGYLAIFLDRPASELDQRYVAEQLLFDSAGLTVNDLRTLMPVHTLVEAEPAETIEVRPNTEWLTVYTGAAVGSTSSLACLAIVAEGEQLESQCRPADEMASQALTLEFTRENRTIRATWSSQGEVSAFTSDPG